MEAEVSYIFLATILGALISGGAVIVSQIVQAKSRRSELILRERLRELTPLQRDIGAVTERVTGWTWRNEDVPDLLESIKEIEHRGGAVWGDKVARQSLRDWAHYARLLIETRVRPEFMEADEISNEVMEADTISTEFMAFAERLVARLDSIQSA